MTEKLLQVLDVAAGVKVASRERVPERVQSARTKARQLERAHHQESEPAAIFPAILPAENVFPHHHAPELVRAQSRQARAIERHLPLFVILRLPIRLLCHRNDWPL